jgi:general stress protein 26
MESINANRPHSNQEDLYGMAAVEKIREMVDKVSTCFFCTAETVAGSSGARPMAVRQVDEAGNLWFLSAKDSHKDQELDLDAEVQLFFQGSEHADFMEIKGRASSFEDRKKIHELWQPMMKTWFSEGVDDPRISVIKVTPTDGHYWETKHGHTVAGFKMLLGAAIGKTLDDSVEGGLRI